jgi:hypothetical protein
LRNDEKTKGKRRQAPRGGAATVVQRRSASGNWRTAVGRTWGRRQWGLGSEEEARRRGKWRPEASRIGGAHVGWREAVSRDGSRGGRGRRAAHGGCGAGEGDGAVRGRLERRYGAAGVGDGGERGCGVSAMDWGRGAVDGVRQGMAMPTEVVARCGSGASGGEVRLEAANMSATSGAG